MYFKVKTKTMNLQDYWDLESLRVLYPLALESSHFKVGRISYAIFHVLYSCTQQ